MPWLVAALVLLPGRPGVLMKSKDEGGKMQRFRIEGGESWCESDNKPRQPYVSTGQHGLDDMSLMLMREMTF